MSSRIAVDQFGSSVSDYSGKEINLHHTDRLYVNERGDNMKGDLNMKKNKIHFDEEQSISYYKLNRFKGIQIKTVGGLYVTDQNDIYYIGICKEAIYINKRKITGVSKPLDNDDATNKKYVDTSIKKNINALIRKYANMLIKKEPKVYITNVKSGESKSFNTDNPRWYAVQISICINHDHQSIFVLKSQANKIFNIRYKGDGIPGTSNYIYNYFGQVFISDVTDNNFVVNVKNFGYISDTNLANFRKRDHLSYYAVVSVVVL